MRLGLHPDSFTQFEKMLFQDASSIFPANFHPEQSECLQARVNFDTSAKKKTKEIHAVIVDSLEGDEEGSSFEEEFGLVKDYN